MPFIENSRRPLLTGNPSLASKPGDLAFLVYREMKRQWRASPCWTTADKVHFDFVLNTEDNEFLEDLFSQMPTVGYNELCNAAALSWQVFFYEYVFPYEVIKKKHNGDVE